ncbi:MAG: biotin/lipoyl-binding protein, partial [Candidatus Magasanikbacteria bacterium]|nr:biotin/lipoyl-binding protein [Candidatus Magasanikbacteria bacterium]
MRLFKKRNIVILVTVLGAAVFLIWRQAAPPSKEIVTARVTRGDLVQSVEPSGSVKSKSEINLNFDMIGRIASLAVKVGDEVKAGQLLARLETKNLDSAINQAAADLAKARGNLAAYEAGATPETIAQYEADVKKAEANLAKAQADLANLKISLKQTFDNGYINQINTLQGSITALETAMTDMDTVLGVENPAANDTFDKAITSLENSSFYYSQAKSDFNNARLKLNEAKTASQTLTTSSTNIEIDAATAEIKTALDAAATALGSTWTVLDKLDVNAPSHNLTISQVTAKKIAIDTDRAAITTKKTLVLTGEQAIAAARLNYEGSAGSAGSSQVAQYEANVKIYEAALSSAQAVLAAKKALPRQVDLASYHAA